MHAWMQDAGIRGLCTSSVIWSYIVCQYVIFRVSFSLAQGVGACGHMHMLFACVYRLKMFRKFVDRRLGSGDNAPLWLAEEAQYRNAPGFCFSCPHVGMPTNDNRRCKICYPRGSYVVHVMDGVTFLRCLKGQCLPSSSAGSSSSHDGPGAVAASARSRQNMNCHQP